MHDSATPSTPRATPTAPHRPPGVDPAHRDNRRVGGDPGEVGNLPRGGIRCRLALIKQLPLIDFPRGHTIFAEDEPGDRLYIIISGKVKMVCRSPEGRENLLTIHGASDMFGELSVFDPGARTSSAITVTEVRAVSMDRAAWRAWIAAQPQIAEQLLGVLARRLRRTDDHLANLIFTDVPGRVAKQLLALGQRFGIEQDGGLRVTHDLTQEEIAQLVGASRETVNKSLADFAQRGWIRLDGKSVLICNSGRLARRAR